MFQRRAKEKAEAALQNSLLAEAQRDRYPLGEEVETTKEWDEGLSERAEDGPDTPRDKKESDTQDSPRLEGDALQLEAQEAEPPARGSAVPFDGPDYRFECICGELGLLDYKARVQCMHCQLWQHADCVNYREESRGTTPFYCPHCLVAMKPVSTGATLIISPSSICHQWVEEINRHIRSSSLRVLVRGKKNIWPMLGCRWS